MASQVTVSICIVNWNTREALRRCLESIARSKCDFELETIVVDNASTDGSAEMVRAQFPWANLLPQQANLYYAAGNNLAMRAARGEFILLLNPDVVLPPEGIARLVAFLRKRPEAAGVAPALRLPDGTIQRSLRTFPGPWAIWCEAMGLARLFPRSRLFGGYRLGHFDYRSTIAVDQPMASCLLLRRSALDRVGLFDEQFPMFFNDVDLCFRLKQAGFALYFTPEVIAEHEHGASTRQVWPEMVRESTRGLLRFYRKHYRGRLCPLVYWPTVALIYVAGAARAAVATWRERGRRRSS